MLHLFQENKSYGIKTMCIHPLMLRHCTSPRCVWHITVRHTVQLMHKIKLLFCKTITFSKVKKRIIAKTLHISIKTNWNLSFVSLAIFGSITAWLLDLFKLSFPRFICYHISMLSLLSYLSCVPFCPPFLLKTWHTLPDVIDESTLKVCSLRK
jgi:hypothetical protein